MTVQDITTLLKEKNDLQENMKSILAQLEAAKQMYNESSNVVFQLKSHIITLGTKLAECQKENAELKDGLKAQYQNDQAQAINN